MQVWPQGCVRRQGIFDAAPEAARQAVGGGCQSGWGRLLSVTNAIEPGPWRQETVAGHRLGALEGGGGATSPPFQCIPGGLRLVEGQHHCIAAPVYKSKANGG